ncbi:MAG: hypothetical protein ACOCXA_05760 [Planctomycetota bacterium]
MVEREPPPHGQKRKGLRWRDIIAIVLILLPPILYLSYGAGAGAAVEYEQQDPAALTLGQMVAAILALPCWVIAVGLILSGRRDFHEDHVEPVHRHDPGHQHGQAQARGHA